MNRKSSSRMCRRAAILASLLPIPLFANTVTFDTTNLTINGSGNTFNGVPFSAYVNGNLAQFNIAGDFTLNAGDTVIFTGARLPSIIVGNNAYISANISVSASGITPGIGGGAGGGGATSVGGGGLGGAGGAGGTLTRGGAVVFGSGGSGGLPYTSGESGYQGYDGTGGNDGVQGGNGANGWNGGAGLNSTGAGLGGFGGYGGWGLYTSPIP
ncbi:MAG: hypothetical protein ACHRHE_13080, partial [Tepidisphaerales bacterium]